MKLAPGEAVITQPALLHARTAPSDLVGYANENGACKYLCLLIL